MFEDAALPGRFLEYFLEENWLAHLRHHERVSEADRALQARVRALHLGPAGPEITHFTTPEA